MIQANELRIGNWVYCSDGKETEIKSNYFAQVVEIFSTGISIFWDGNIFVPGNYEPIPLTQEILEKCGFEKTGSTNFENNKHIISFLVKQYDDNSILLAVKNEYETCKIGIYKHVHQLQNVYHAITGTELEINLTE